MIRFFIPTFRICAAWLGLTCAPVFAATYEIGPQCALRSIKEAPWDSLKPGDQVLIHWRPEPYREKWAIAVSGSADAPIVVRGVAGPNGQLPVIDGRDAVPVHPYVGWARSIIKIGDQVNSASSPPSHIILENLDVCGAIPSASFPTGQSALPYLSYASALWIQKGEDIVIRHCALHDSANGLVTSHESSHILVERCRIYGNGLEKSTQEHNVYTESDGIVFQFNRIGPLRVGALGNTLKDRSAGTVVRYNWLEGGSRNLDLVDSDYETIRSRPSYRATYVYGNVMLKDDTGAANQVVHYGGDSGHEENYRHGVLNFYHNTVVVYRQPLTILFRLSSADDSVNAVNNIFCSALGGGRLNTLVGGGSVALDHNLVAPGLKAAFLNGGEEGVKSIHNLDSVDPQFADLKGKDFRPRAASISVGQPLALKSLADHPVLFEYRDPAGFAPRSSAAPIDVGAFSRLGDIPAGTEK